MLREKLELLIEAEYRGHSDMSLADAFKVARVTLESLPCRCERMRKMDGGDIVLTCDRCSALADLEKNRV